MPTCEWFALCDNETLLAARGPIGGGEWGYLPVCKRCADRFDLDTLPILIDAN